MGSRSAEFIYNAIAPAEVDQVIFDDEDSKHALVVVPDNKLSLAIGRRGQNVRLAAHLTVTASISNLIVSLKKWK